MKRFPATLLLGAAIILACEGLLAIDVARRGGVIAGHGAPIPEPHGILEIVARQAAINMTPVCWVGYLFILDGVLALGAAGSPARRRPRLFIACCLTSVPIWLFFDWINFWFIKAWDYHNLPESFVHRNLGYFVAFATINPGMFLSGEAIRRTRIGACRARPLRVGRAECIGLMLLGVAALGVQFVWRDPVANLTLWMAFPLIFDPLNRLLGRPSILADAATGRYGRLVALLLGGLWCGFLWEFWNYWAVTKWTYDLPFLGTLESIRYFEMPVPGLAGFPPFAVGCWAAFVLLAWPLERARLTEPVPDEQIL